MATSKLFKSMICVGAAGMIVVGSGAAFAGFDQNVTPDVIFGTGGNLNGGFTTDRNKGVEIGLRGKQRFPPANIFNSNGDGTYSFPTGSGTGSGPPTSQYPVWSFEWSINTDYEDAYGKKLDDYRYELGLDGDPSIGTNFVSWDPVILGPNGCADHSLGTNATPNYDVDSVGGIEASCPAGAAAYKAALGVFNVAQQSWRYGFFPFLGSLNGFDPTVAGVYDIYLLARNSKGKVVAKTTIRILVGLTNGLPNNKKDCKNGGWATFDALFASQKECKKFVKKNKDDDD